MTKKDPQEIISDFRTHVNMSVKELQDFLETKESKDVGWKPDGGESTGHESGRYICELIPKKDDDFTDDDLQHMTHVNAYCKRHLAQRPQKVEGSKWLYSLKNWYSLSVTLCVRRAHSLQWNSTLVVVYLQGSRSYQVIDGSWRSSLGGFCSVQLPSTICFVHHQRMTKSLRSEFSTTHVYMAYMHACMQGLLKYSDFITIISVAKDSHLSIGLMQFVKHSDQIGLGRHVCVRPCFQRQVCSRAFNTSVRDAQKVPARLQCTHTHTDTHIHT